MFKNKLTLSTLCILVIIFAIPAFADNSRGKNVKTLRINWEEVELAEKYRVQIADNTDTIVLDNIVTSHYIKFTLPEGTYRIRIGVITKFGKLAVWTDWRFFNISRRALPKHSRGTLNLGLKLGIGGCFFHLLPDFDKYYKSSFISGTALLGYSLGKLAMYTPMKFLRYTGVEIEANYLKLEGKEISDGASIDNTYYLAGGNFYITTVFDFPVNLLFRAGGGMSYSTFEYMNVDTAGNDISLYSLDPYYKIGCAVEVSLSKIFFLEGGADYYSILYIGDELRTLRYFLRVGIRL